ncbi:MAG: TetR/AcrR family transcriptional regulator [Eubacteriaceae bacterium]|nr:TetR/AcrR family transcriptional regulator [Eubacteriaceae bacterium]
MPPKSRITREMIADAAVALIREEGYESVNARAVAKKLGCSTQPVMYQFATMEELKREAYSAADRLHTAYLMKTAEGTDPLTGMGLNYIRFAKEEPDLFRFLFQSGYARENSVMEMIGSADLDPVISAIEEESSLSAEKSREIFLTLAMFVHGYASLIAGNGLEFDEELVASQLQNVFYGAIAAASGEEEK